MDVVTIESNWLYHKRLFHNQGFSEDNKVCILMDSYRVGKAVIVGEFIYLLIYSFNIFIQYLDLIDTVYGSVLFLNLKYY